jgi:hypothetical protein
MERGKSTKCKPLTTIIEKKRLIFKALYDIEE